MLRSIMTALARPLSGGLCSGWCPKLIAGSRPPIPPLKSEIFVVRVEIDNSSGEKQVF
jgi:hypothetical protein